MTLRQLVQRGVIEITMAITLAFLVVVLPIPATAADEGTDLETLQFSLAEIIQKLIDQGTITPEEAAAMIERAQTKASEAAAQREPKEDEVRVSYVPEFIREEIRNEVRNDLRGEVAEEVKRSAREEGWGVPAGLPQWVNALKWSGDLRVRGEADLFDGKNQPYEDSQAINEAGGVSAAGLDALVNNTQDRYVTRARLRLGVEAELASGFVAGARLSTGVGDNPVTRNSTLGRAGTASELLVDRVYLSYSSSPLLTLRAGRLSNPWMGTELLWDNDLTFEGLSIHSKSRLWGDSPDNQAHAFLTAGAFPLQEVEFSSRDALLYGVQLGGQWSFAENSFVGVGLGWFDYDNIEGRANSPFSQLNDFTAPAFLQKGNTLFNIRNDPTDPDAELRALASDYDLANITAVLRFGNSFADDETPLAVTITGDYVRNLGFDGNEVAARRGERIAERTDGYLIGVDIGWPQLSRFGSWSVFGEYRHLERDAVLDAFADSDFHLGGTDAEGFILGMDLGLSEGAWARLKYLSANEIDGLRFGVDVLQLDLNARF